MTELRLNYASGQERKMHKVVHYIKKNTKPYSCITFLGDADLCDTACGCTMLSLSHELHRYSMDRSKVTCKKCKKVLSPSGENRQTHGT